MVSFALTRDKSVDEKEIWVEKVKLLFRLGTEEDKESKKMALVPFVDCVPSRNGMGDAWGCLNMRWATAICGEKTVK